MITPPSTLKLSLTVLLALLLQCCNPWSAETERALKLAGENRGELEKVLRYYNKEEADSLKFKAAEYLISNMTYQYSEFGQGIDSLNKAFEYVYGVYTADRERVSQSDSVKQRRSANKEVEYDLLRISSGQLIEQIEAAFDTYNRFEWCRKYPFEIFCEHILPYKLGNSDPVNWRNHAFEKYSTLLHHSAFESPGTQFEAEQFALSDSALVRAEGASGQLAFHLKKGAAAAFEMEFDTKLPGFQLLKVHYLNGYTTAAKVRIMVDNTTIGDFIFPATGSWQTVDKDILPVEFTAHLDAGKHKLKLIALDKNILLDFVSIPEYINMKLPESAISQGYYYLKNSLGSLTVEKDSLVNTAKFKIQPKPSREWPFKLVANEGNLYQMAFEQDAGTTKALDAYPGSTSEVVHVYDSHGQLNQKWAFVPMGNGGYQIINKGTGNILAYSEKDSTVVQLPLGRMSEDYIWQLQKIEGLVDNSPDTVDMSVRAAQKISEITNRFHWPGPQVVTGPINLTYLLDYPYGTCEEETKFQTMVLRSMGVACTIDFLFNYPERRGGHSWSIIFDPKGNAIQNNCHHAVGAGTWVDKYSKGKVYRRTNSINPNSLFMKNNGGEPIPAQFQTPYFIDVTREYSKVNDIEVNISEEGTAQNSFGYLLVFNYTDWVVTGWGERKGKAIEFKDVVPGVMYLPAFYKNGIFEGLNDPFYLDSLGNVHHMTASKNEVLEIALKRKFPNRMVNASFHEKIIGGKFQGANKADFSDSVTIGTITTEMLDPVFHNITVDTKGPFKYLRYIGPDGGHCNISEIEFFDSKGNIVSGEIIGTEGSLQNNGNTKDKVFDGDVLTYFDAPEASGNWVGLKLSNRASISKIRFVARNDGNMVEIGDEYELVYWGDREWKSLGKQTAVSDSLIFDRVPKNALYVLHNHTKGSEERIFILEKGEQVWW